jgi:lysozyme family protein
MAAPVPLATDGPAGHDAKTHNGTDLSSREGYASSDELNLKNEVYDSSAIDPVLAKKMALINNAIDEIGMTPWQWKVFLFNGFGYAVDSVSHVEMFYLFIVADSFNSF